MYAIRSYYVTPADFKPERSLAIAALLDGLREEQPAGEDLVLTIPDPRA